MYPASKVHIHAFNNYCADSEQSLLWVPTVACVLYTTPGNRESGPCPRADYDVLTEPLDTARGEPVLSRFRRVICERVKGQRVTLDDSRSFNEQKTRQSGPSTRMCYLHHQFGGRVVQGPGNIEG